MNIAPFTYRTVDPDAVSADRHAEAAAGTRAANGRTSPRRLRRGRSD